MAIAVQPVTPERWDDLLALFGPQGAYSNCWCTWWRMGGKDWDAAGATGRRALLEDLVADGSEPGLLAYVDGVPAGWVAVAPREEYPRLNRSPHTRAVDDVPVWSITCFWVERSHRGRGVAAALLEAAVAFAAGQGAVAVEGYPVDPEVRSCSPADSYTGVVTMFEQAGFSEIARRSPTSRVVMRRSLD